MEPDYRKEEGNKKAKADPTNRTQKDIVITKYASLLKTIGEAGGGVLFIAALVGFAWTHKSWLFWSTLVLLPLAAFLLGKLRKWSTAKQILSTGIAVASSVIGAWLWSSLGTPAQITWRPPSLSNGCQQVEVVVGGTPAFINIRVLTNGGTRLGPMTSEACYYFVTNHALFADVNVNTGKKPATIRVGRVSNLPEGWDCNYNSNKFEIVNENSFPVYQCSYPVAERIEIYGCLLGSGSVFAVGPGMHATARLDFDPFELGLKPIFRYPSKQNLGSLAGE